MAAERTPARACRCGKSSCLLGEEMVVPQLWCCVELEQGSAARGPKASSARLLTMTPARLVWA